MIFAKFGWNYTSGSGEDEKMKFKVHHDDDKDRQWANFDQQSSRAFCSCELNTIFTGREIIHARRNYKFFLGFSYVKNLQ